MFFFFIVFVIGVGIFELALAGYPTFHPTHCMRFFVVVLLRFFVVAVVAFFFIYLFCFLFCCSEDIFELALALAGLAGDPTMHPT